MKKPYEIDPMGLITLSARQTLRRVLFWARLAVWRFFFSLPLITMPAAKAAFYHAVAAGLRDPFEQQARPRALFVQGFFDHFVRSTLVSLTNLLALAVILFGILFWAAQEQFYLNLLAGLALPFLVFWWLCQPYLYPVLVDNPGDSVRQVFRRVFRLAAGHPLYSFVQAFSLTLLALASVLLVGPLSLVTAPFLALVAVQGTWAVNGAVIPDLVDPVRYADMRDAEQRRAAAGRPEREA